MNETTDQTDDFILDHPTTLKIYLYMKAKAPKEVSIREAQRVLEVKSTSTVSWHLTKLEDAGYAEKLPTNKYKLTAKAEKKQEIKIPVVIPAQLIRGVIIPRNLLLLSFLLVAAVISFILIWINPLLSSILGTVFIVIALALGIFEYSFLRKQLRFYRFLSEENSSQKKEED